MAGPAVQCQQHLYRMFSCALDGSRGKYLSFVVRSARAPAKPTPSQGALAVPSSWMSETRGPELQREVQRLLGRCLLRLQQYERLMKAMLAHQDATATASDLGGQVAARAEAFADKSLGILVKALFESLIVSDSDREPSDSPKASSDAATISVRFQHRIAMDSDRLAGVKAAVEDLVKLRNGLVHHLIDRFDLWSDDGCAAAQARLEQCYARIDRHFHELAGWAESMDKARASMASFMQTAEFEAWLVDGIAPDGTVD